jgi:uncharacterized protein (TIGR03905 family)
MIKNIDVRRYIYHTHGVCPPEIHFKIDDGKIKNLRFVGGGCPGNAQLVSRLLEGKPLAEVLGNIKGIDCRNDTSCPQELAAAIQAVEDGSLEVADSFRVRDENIPRQSIAIIGNPAGDNLQLEKILEHIQGCDVDAILCFGNITGDSRQNENLIKSIRRNNIFAIQGEIDWHYSLNNERPDMPTIEQRSRDWLLQLPQVLSFHLDNRKCMAFFGDYLQSFSDFSDFETFALEMNMVCGLTRFMQDETVFPALEAMIPQFQADVILFSQMKTWDRWHVAGKDIISVGEIWDGSGLTWGLLSENDRMVDLKIMKVEP